MARYHDALMRRGDFERLVQRHLDPALLPRGFRLTPQGPADVDDKQPSAVYEAETKDFARRFPRLAGNLSDAPCVDFWVHLNPTSGRISSELEGPSLEDVMGRLGVISPAPAENANLEAQLDGLARSIAAMLDAARSETP
jgi:hypothetical protein